MTYALAAPEFDKFADEQRPEDLFSWGLTQYDKNWPWLKYVIAPEKTGAHLAQVFADLQYKNLRTAETEKVRARDLFFQRWSGEPFGGEERISGAVAESCDVRFEAGDVRRGKSRNTVVRPSRRASLTPFIMEFANADMVGIRKTGSGDQGGGSRGTQDWATFIRP